MIDLIEEAAFWEFCAQHNTIIQHQPNGDKLKGLYRFARFNDEGTIGELSHLGSPRLEMRDNPVGIFDGNDAGYSYDTMSRLVRAIKKVEANNQPAKLAAQNDCKKALAEIVRYMTQQKEEGDTCAAKIIRMADVSGVTYEIIENATSDGSFTGAQMRIKYTAGLDTTPVAYGTFTYP